MARTVTEQSVMDVMRAARPSFRNAHDKVVFAVHASFLASGFVLHSTGPPAFIDDALSSPSTEEVGIGHCNEFDDCYAFVYSNPKISSKKILVKYLALNDKLLIDALREGVSDELFHLEINVPDYVAKDGGDNNNNYASMFKNFGKLVRDVDNEIVGRFSGSSTASSSNQKPSSETRGAQRGDSKQPSRLTSEPDDQYNINPPSQGYIVPPIPDMGYSDLFPGPGVGVYPARRDYGQPGSMLIGPNDPRFFGVGREPRLPGGSPPGIPPGARFDPYGPPDVPGFGPNRFNRNPRRPWGGTHPDLEHFHDEGVPGFEPNRFSRNPRRPWGGIHPDLEHFHDEGVPEFEPNRFSRNPRRPWGGIHPYLEHFHEDSDIL